MLSLKRCFQISTIGIVVFSADLFSASGFVSSDYFGCTAGKGINTGIGEKEKTFDFVFSTDARGWVSGFADYPQGQDSFFELISNLRPLLPDLNPNRNGLFISGNNHSDDLFMFVKRRVANLAPNQSYQVNFEVEIGSEAGSDCLGAGGSPAIALKAGASIIEPLTRVDASGFLRMNIDKGNQGTSGRDAQVLGNIGVDVDCTDPVFRAKRLQSASDDPFEVTTNGSGAVWLIVGTDSSFEGVTRLFYTRITTRFSRK